MADISEAALARKKRFQEAKAEAGGAENLVESIKNRPWRVYFTADGEIVSFTNSESVEPQEDWLTYNFTREQVSPLHDADLRKFHIVQDPKTDKVYTIQLKPIETSFVSSDHDFLYEVDYGKTTKFDVKCSITKKHLTVSVSKAVKESYSDVYPISATVNGQRLLKFSITAEKDPHFVYHQEIVAIADLLINDSVKRELPMDLTHCSIYTNKLFDTYVRK